MSPSMWAWRVIIPGLGLAACSLVLWQSTRGDAPSRPTPAHQAETRTTAARVIAEGRIAARPGAEITLSSEVAGTILNVQAREKARVRKGDLLVEFRADDLQAGLVEAEARVVEIDVEINFQKREYQRRAKNPTEAPLFQSDLDGARRDLEVATARRKGAVAGLDRARLALARARVLAPIDGVILGVYLQAGETAPPGARLVTICDLARVRVEAEVDEFDAARIKEGDEVLVKAEGLGEAAWTGAVEEIPDRVAERTARPDDPGRPSDTRVLLVKIALARPTPLKLGQQVEVEIRPRR